MLPKYVLRKRKRTWLWMSNPVWGNEAPACLEVEAGVESLWEVPGPLSFCTEVFTYWFGPLGLISCKEK